VTGMSALDDIYSPENIARSRARAASIRRSVVAGELAPYWLETADEMDAYALERELNPKTRVIGSDDR
jgi:hypothetical protein